MGSEMCIRDRIDIMFAMALNLGGNDRAAGASSKNSADRLIARRAPIIVGNVQS